MHAVGGDTSQVNELADRLCVSVHGRVAQP